MSGYSEVFNDKLKEIEEETKAIEGIAQRFESDKVNIIVTEDMVRGYFSNFKTLVEQRDFPQIKRFLDSYIDRIDVYDETIKVTFKVAFSLCPNGDYVYHFEREVARIKTKTA